MFLTDIKHRVGNVFGLSTDTFEIQVHDEHCNRSFVMDDEYVENLQQQLSHIYIHTLSGDILLNCSTSGVYSRNHCDEEAKLTQFGVYSPSECISTDYDNRAPEEVSMMQHTEDDAECFKKLLFTASEENEIKTLGSNDEIKKNICYPDTSISEENLTTPFDSNDDEIDIIENIDLDAQVVVQNVVDIVLKQSIDIGAKPIESFDTNWHCQNSDDLLSHLPDQISQQTPSLKLSQSLQFAHDVHPYQKTEHTADTFDQCLNKDIPPYVMCIQGIKTAADKGKSVLPMIKIPQSYMAIYQQQKQSLFLIVFVVREEKVNNKRMFHECKEMRFLPADVERKTDAVNPIRLNLRSLPIEPDGTFKLSLRLMNNSSQSTTEENNSKSFYQLDEELATNLHPSPYNPKFFRLACILAKEDTIAWNTLCLSDYIRPKHQIQA